MRSNMTLIGFQSSGKTLLGKLLAERLKCNFVDTDRLIEKKHGVSLTCAQIHKKLGDSYFRDLESQVLHEIEGYQNTVVAIGGGSLLREENGLSLKKHSTLFYLKTPIDIIKTRLWEKPALPSYLDEKNPEESFNRIYNKRFPIYERWADVILEMEVLSNEQAIDKIMSANQF